MNIYTSAYMDNEHYFESTYLLSKQIKMPP